MSRKVEKLQPAVQEKWLAAVALMEAAGTRFCLVSTLRTTEEQVAYYAQGRKDFVTVCQLRAVAGLPPIEEYENKYTITNCDGIKILSNHQYGTAVDVVPVQNNGNPYWPPAGALAWIPIREAMEAAGFTSGSRWKSFPDWPHYEFS